MKLEKYFGLLLFMLVAIYLLFSFNATTFNIKEWNSIDRNMCACFMALSFWVAHLILKYLENES